MQRIIPPWKINRTFLRKKAKQHRIARRERPIHQDLDKRAAFLAELDMLVEIAAKKSKV